MPTPSTGQISFKDITDEFGTPTNSNLGAFRVSQTIAGRTWTLDTGVPTSGQIKFSDLRGKKANIVIDSGTGSDEFNVTLTNYFATKSPTVVGGFRNPAATLAAEGGKKYHIVLRRDYGGATGSNYSIRSGAWPTGSDLNVYVDSGTIYGRGGSGGTGGCGNGSGGGAGSAGLNAIGFSYGANLTISSGTAILAGAGGGGGGSGTHHNPDPGPFDPTYCGGSGGGGRGNPGGPGGGGNRPGVAGSKSSGGDAGQPEGQGNIGFAGGGGGGGGWSAGSVGSGSRGASPGTSTGSGGNGGGGPGVAIRQVTGIAVTVTNNGTCLPTATPATVAAL